MFRAQYQTAANVTQTLEHADFNSLLDLVFDNSTNMNCEDFVISRIRLRFYEQLDGTWQAITSGVNHDAAIARMNSEYEGT